MTHDSYAVKTPCPCFHDSAIVLCFPTDCHDGTGMYMYPQSLDVHGPIKQWYPPISASQFTQETMPIIMVS